MPNFNIRKYLPEDQPHLVNVCYRTGYFGEDLTNRHFFDDPHLFGLIFILYYAWYEPEHIFVVENQDNQEVVGYIAGSPNTVKQEEKFNRLMRPRILRHALTHTLFRSPRTFFNLLTQQRARTYPLREEMPRSKILREYPAHLHIDLLPVCQGQGMGSKLLITYLDHMKTLGVSGIHLVTTNLHTKALPFYAKHGFTLVRTEVLRPYPKLGEIQLLTFIKDL